MPWEHHREAILPNEQALRSSPGSGIGERNGLPHRPSSGEDRTPPAIPGSIPGWSISGITTRKEARKCANNIEIGSVSVLASPARMLRVGSIPARSLSGSAHRQNWKHNSHSPKGQENTMEGNAPNTPGQPQEMTEEELAAMLEAEESNVATASDDEDEDEVVEEEPGVAVKEVSTTNTKLEQEIKVKVRVPLAPSVSDYAGENFYGSEEKVKKALDADWSRRKANSVRPVLRDAERELDWQAIAQQTADQYKPGRRGGFAPSIGRDELSGATSIDDVIALLQAKGVQIV